MNRVMFFVVANMFITFAIIFGDLNPYIIMLWFWNLAYLFLGEN